MLKFNLPGKKARQIAATAEACFGSNTSNPETEYFYHIAPRPPLALLTPIR